MGVDGKQQNMLRSSSPHTQEMKQTHQRSATLRTKTRGSNHREKKLRVQIISVCFPLTGSGKNTGNKCTLNQNNTHMVVCWQAHTGYGHEHDRHERRALTQCLNQQNQASNLNLDQKAVIARIEKPKDKENTEATEPTGAITRSTSGKHRSTPLNTTPTPTRRPTQHRLRNSIKNKLEETVTTSVSTTEKSSNLKTTQSRPNGHAVTLRKPIQKRNSAPTDEKQTKKHPSKSIKKTIRAIKKQREKTEHLRHLVQLSVAQKHHLDQHKTEESRHHTHATQ